VSNDLTNQRIILLVNPANELNRQTTFEIAIYPNLGLLTLGTALRNALIEKKMLGQVLYFDGALHGNHFLYDYIVRYANQIAVIGLSSYTYNYKACVELASYAKRFNPNVVNIIGNDHFSALYREVMLRQEGVFDYGFYGNDVVEGFTQFVVDLLLGRLNELLIYPGLVFRDSANSNKIHRNPEEPIEFSRLPYVDYSLLDSLLPHSDGYHQEQLENYLYMKEDCLRATVIDLARGCLKFGGPRNENGVPLNACDFCGIIPGSKAIAAPEAQRAWAIIRNAVEQGYNYLFVTADELPSTFWYLLNKMAENRPDWYLEMSANKRPRFMCYARADAFREQAQYRIDILMNILGFDHFFVGLDGFTTISLRAMNKGINKHANENNDLLHYNLLACQEIAKRGGMLTAGAVLTHIGITREIMEANFRLMRQIIKNYSHLFVELDFELLCPVPGSLSFDYLRKPGNAQARANELGLEVNNHYLETIISKYQDEDVFDPEEMVQDFILGCCPDITVEFAYDYLRKTRELVEEYKIVYECSSL
jgi:hypothetical protein